MRKWQKTLLVLYWLAAPAAVGAIAQIISGLPFTLTNGTVADATQVMADFNQIVNNTNANAAKNGVNSDITALTALVTPITPTQGGSTAFAATVPSTGSANAQVIATVAPTTFALTANYHVTFVPGFTNTGATTLNVVSTGATNVFKTSFSGPIALTGGEIVSGALTTVSYDGTRYMLLNTPTAPGIATNLASAATTDLGTVASHNVQVTGTTGITAFGSTAQTDFPFYNVRFSGALTITHNATSLILPGAVNLTTAASDTGLAQYLGSGNWQIVAYQRAAVAVPAVTVQSCASGLTCDNSSHTYTPTSGTQRIRVRLIGGGGGGGARTTNSGATGNTSTFGSWTALGGAGGGPAGTGGSAGGAGGATGTGTLIVRMAGNPGGSGGGTATANTLPAGGTGGASPLGGAGPGGSGGSGSNATANSGSGGGGPGGASGAASAAGGASGEYVEFWVNGPGAITYTIGTGGAGGAAGGIAGGAGATGNAVIEEFYQ